jgi:hypothetical protein
VPTTTHHTPTSFTLLAAHTMDSFEDLVWQRGGQKAPSAYPRSPQSSLINTNLWDRSSRFVGDLPLSFVAAVNNFEYVVGKNPATQEGYASCRLWWLIQWLGATRGHQQWRLRK